MCSERDGSTLLPVWTGESAMSKQACLFEYTHTYKHTLLCVAGEQVAQKAPVAARWLCVMLEEVLSDPECSICHIGKRKDEGGKEGARLQQRAGKYDSVKKGEIQKRGTTEGRKLERS